MTANKIDSAISLIDSSGKDRPILQKKFAVSTQQVEELEKKLGFSLPESYQHFLLNYGSGAFEGWEFYGLIPDKSDHPDDVYSFTVELREEHDLPNDLLAIENFDGDSVACLLLSALRDGECPVILWDHSEGERQIRKPYILANSFGDYFFEKVEDAIE